VSGTPHGLSPTATSRAGSSQKMALSTTLQRERWKSCKPFTSIDLAIPIFICLQPDTSSDSRRGGASASDGSGRTGLSAGISPRLRRPPDWPERRLKEKTPWPAGPDRLSPELGNGTTDAPLAEIPL